VVVLYSSPNALCHAEITAKFFPASVRSPTILTEKCKDDRGGAERDDVLKVWERRSSFNVQKVMWPVGELELAHAHVDAGDSGVLAPHSSTLNFLIPYPRVQNLPYRDWVLSSEGSFLEAT
jgi:hypothetical protein